MTKIALWTDDAVGSHYGTMLIICRVASVCMGGEEFDANDPVCYNTAPERLQSAVKVGVKTDEFARRDSGKGYGGSLRCDGSNGRGR